MNRGFCFTTFSVFAETMRRGFLLSDGKKFSVTAPDEENMKKIQVTKRVLDEDLGVSMLKIDHESGMDVKIKVDEKGNVTMITKPSEH